MYALRICWNTEGWKRPTGEAFPLETDSWVARARFGHEEWLFEPRMKIDGWKYVWLQPLGKPGGRHTGEVMDIKLFTISPAGERFWVGRLRGAEKLTKDQAGAARIRFMARGWLKRMVEQALEVGSPASLANVDTVGIFNVRIREKGLIPYDHHELIKPGDRVQKLNRYLLYSL